MIYLNDHRKLRQQAIDESPLRQPSMRYALRSQVFVYHIVSAENDDCVFFACKDWAGKGQISRHDHPPFQCKLCKKCGRATQPNHPPATEEGERG